MQLAKTFWLTTIARRMMHSVRRCEQLSGRERNLRGGGEDRAGPAQPRDWVPKWPNEVLQLVSLDARGYP